jgi:methyl-accepting chemotaxis protein
MAETINARQLIRLAQCLTRMQQALTDYELRHYPELDPSQKRKLEETLGQLATAAGRMYAYSVQLVFDDTESQLKQLQEAAGGLKKFLKTVQKIQQVLDVVSSVASLAEAIISQNVNGIAVETDQIIQMLGNN